MTIQVQIKLLNANGNHHLTVLEVTEAGIQSVQKAQRITTVGGVLDFQSIWGGKAILLAEGNLNLDAPDNDMYRVVNPLEEFLRREHPSMPLQDELRLRLAKAEKERDEAKQDAAEMRRRLSAVTKAMASAV